MHDHTLIVCDDTKLPRGFADQNGTKPMKTMEYYKQKTVNNINET